MAKIRRMTRTQNQDASSSMRFKSCENNGAAPWVDLNNELLFLIMMQLGFFDFIAFGGVCKSWRSLAVSHWNEFIASRPPTPPMKMRISNHALKKDWYCCLEDFEGRKFKTIIPHSAGRIYVGLTCGYLILIGKETNDFWLVNPITRDELHFPCIPFSVSHLLDKVTAILVFSSSIKRWMFVVLNASDFSRNIWFSIAGTRKWNRVDPTFYISDLHAFKGKIYVWGGGQLGELRFDPKPELMLLETWNFLEPYSTFRGLVSWGENLYLLQFISQEGWHLYKLDYVEMTWVWQEKAIEEYAFFRSNYNYCVAIKPVSWASHPLTQYKRYAFFTDNPTDALHKKRRFFFTNMWYFPHDYSNVNLIDE